MSNTTICDKCKAEERENDIIWITAEDFEPREGEVLKQSDEQYDALCDFCYHTELED